MKKDSFKRCQLNIDLDCKLRDRVKMQAIQDGVSLHEWTQAALRSKLNSSDASDTAKPVNLRQASSKRDSKSDQAKLAEAEKCIQDLKLAAQSHRINPQTILLKAKRVLVPKTSPK